MAQEPHGHYMKFPYTFTAKLVQFPYRLFWERSWLTRYFIYGSIATMPIMYKLQKLSYHPENVKKWAEIRRKQFAGETH